MPLARPTWLIKTGGLMSLSLILGQAAAGAPPAVEPARSTEAEVQTDRLDVFDQPNDTAFIIGRVFRGDRLRVRLDQTPGLGWLAVEPLPTSICWIEQSSIEFEDDGAAEMINRYRDPGDQDRDRACRAWVSRPEAMIRSGHPRARMPGPPKGRLREGTLVQLVDRPPLLFGQGADQVRWLAIVPPADQTFYVHAGGVSFLSPTLAVPPSAEIRASYEESGPERKTGGQSRGAPTGPASSWPHDITAELERIDGMFQAIVASQPIEQWRFETVRAGYQALLKRTADRADLEDALRTRLARVTQHEQAARAARTIESILAASHRRDDELATVRQDRDRQVRSRTRAYDAVGFVQPSARKVDGHRIFALIGREGSTIAYLDIPPGLDPEPFLARRVGVRGQAHYNEDLGTRLITVRDLESIEARK
jgi:hypothetical protein